MPETTSLCANKGLILNRIIVLDNNTQNHLIVCKQTHLKIKLPANYSFIKPITAS